MQNKIDSYRSSAYLYIYTLHDFFFIVMYSGPTPCRHGAFYADTCNKFVYYRCMWGRPITRKCNANLVWNQKKKYCSWSK